MTETHYFLIVVAALISIASPGPATLAIADASMSKGRSTGLALASGVLTGSLFWSISAAFGLAALMYANVWLVEFFRYLGSAYLLFLAFKSLRSAFRSENAQAATVTVFGLRSAYLKGLLLHLTNPKAILFFSALYSIGVPVGASEPDGVGESDWYRGHD